MDMIYMVIIITRERISFDIILNINIRDKTYFTYLIKIYYE